MTLPSAQLVPSTTFLTQSSKETEDVGRIIAEGLTIGDVICLTGDLGAGKTTLVKGLVQKITGTLAEEVVSPTFTYLNIYPGPTNIYHFDLYRLSSGEEFLQAGFHEFLGQNGVCCIEWPDRLPDKIPIKKTYIHIEYLSAKERKITLRRPNESISS